MKKAFLFAFALTFVSIAHSQNTSDAVRYASEELSGTARFTAMSGAFGALGGDFSAIKINPAGSAVFLNGAGSVSLNLKNFNNDVNFSNGFSSISESDFSLNQAGAVFVFRNTSKESPFRKFTVGLTYEQTANFDDQLFAFGNNTQSIRDYFLNRANGVPLTLFTPQGNESLSDLYAYLGSAPIPTGYNYGNYDMQSAYLGYETFIFDAENPGDLEGNTAYISNIAGNDFYQEYSQVSTGMNGKFTVNTATQFGENLYLGINLNSHFINFERTTRFYEENSHPDSEINKVYYENTLSTLGSGISFQVGAIYKLGNMFRVGAAYTSPTWYVISEETLQYLETDSNEFGSATADPRVINIFPDYQLRTPGKFTGSLAMVFGRSGLLSFDYSYKNYSNTEFDSEFNDRAFSAQNAAIENNLKGASTYRVGGEYRIEAWSLRGGYRFEESPYENEEVMGNLSGYSLGFGYDFGNLELDFAYDFYQREYHQNLLQTGLQEQAFVDNHNSNYTVTLSFGI